jgi:hypothetical protein
MRYSGLRYEYIYIYDEKDDGKGRDDNQLSLFCKGNRSHEREIITTQILKIEEWPSDIVTVREGYHNKQKRSLVPVKKLHSVPNIYV